MFIIDLLPTRVYPLVEIDEVLSYTVLRENLHTVDFFRNTYLPPRLNVSRVSPKLLRT